MEPDHSKLIDDLGGTQAVAALTKQSKQHVSRWRKVGIPWKYRTFLKGVAEAQNIPLPYNFDGVDLDGI